MSEITPPQPPMMEGPLEDNPQQEELMLINQEQAKSSVWNTILNQDIQATGVPIEKYWSTSNRLLNDYGKTRLNAQENTPNIIQDKVDALTKILHPGESVFILLRRATTSGYETQFVPAIASLNPSGQVQINKIDILRGENEINAPENRKSVGQQMAEKGLPFPEFVRALSGYDRPTMQTFLNEHQFHRPYATAAEALADINLPTEDTALTIDPQHDRFLMPEYAYREQLAKKL